MLKSFHQPVMQLSDRIPPSSPGVETWASDPGASESLWVSHLEDVGNSDRADRHTIDDDGHLLARRVIDGNP